MSATSTSPQFPAVAAERQPAVRPVREHDQIALERRSSQRSFRWAGAS